MRIALIADIHGNALALEAVLADIREQNVDLIFDLGDRVSGPLWPNRTHQRLIELGIPGVRGNHDRIVGSGARDDLGRSDAHAFDQIDPAGRSFLAALPFRSMIVPGIEAFHATPERDDSYLIDTIHDGRVVRAPIEEIAGNLGQTQGHVFVVGHSHRPEAIRLLDGRWIINPGSVGCPAYEDDDIQPHVSETGTPHARYAILRLDTQTNDPEIAFRTINYDFEVAAQEAERNGRPEWAYGLRTGFMPVAKA